MTFTNSSRFHAICLAVDELLEGVVHHLTDLVVLIAKEFADSRL